MIFCLLQSIIILIINYYWYFLIVKGLIRLLKELGVIKKKVTDNFEDLDTFESHG